MENVCCGFGHRKIYGNIPRIGQIIEELSKMGIAEYLTGGMGDFDRIFSETVKRVSEAKLILVLPYMTAEVNKNKEYFESLYDEIIIPQCVEGLFPKGAVKLRNRWMVERSSIAVGHITNNYGGAYEAMKYAEKNRKDHGVYIKNSRRFFDGDVFVYSVKRSRYLPVGASRLTS